MNGVTDTASGDLKRAGFSDFENDGTFDATTETYHTSVPEPALVKKKNSAQHHRWNGSSWAVIVNSNIEDIDLNWENSFVDYKAARTQMYIEMVTVGGFSSLSDIEKKIVSRWFIVDNVDRDTVHTLSEQIEYGKVFHALSVESRKRRLSMIMLEVYNRLDYSTEVIPIIDEMNSAKILYNYVELGQEGLSEGDIEGVYDYIDSQYGSQWGGAKEVLDVTAVDASALDGKYVLLADENGIVAFWFDVDNSGTAEPSHGATRSVEVTTITTGMTAAQVATEMKNTIDADTKFSASANGTIVTATNETVGNMAGQSAGTSGFTVNVTVEGAAKIGMSAKSYIPAEMANMQELADKLMGILKNGS